MSAEGLTVEELDALPRGAEVYDADGDRWKKPHLDGMWRWGGLRRTSAGLVDMHGPIRLPVASFAKSPQSSTDAALLHLRAAVSEVLVALRDPGDLVRIVAMGAHETLRRALDEAERLAAGE